MLLLSAILWFAEPAPLDMPRAEAHLVTESGGTRRLEDRYDRLDLWTAREVLGRWKDRDGRRLTVAKLDAKPPKFADGTMTRVAFERDLEPLVPKDGDALALAVSRLSPFDLPEEPSSPRQQIKGLEKVLYWHGTNTSAVVCTFLPGKCGVWYFASWEFADGDDPAVAAETFEDEFLGDWPVRVKEGLRSELASEGEPGTSGRRGRDRLDERELLRRDAWHTVTNYPNWHFTSAREFCVLDDLPSDNAFVRSLTNELSAMRAKYAAALPARLDVSNVLSVARIFKDRDEYLGALDVYEIEGMEWSGAYWSQRRRELVAYLPADGARELLKTFRHEAFHQYLSYACSMITASPWINEGYAQYFEDTESADWGIEVDIEAAAEYLPSVLAMDYVQFYSGTSATRTFNYRMAWSVCYFLEKGAPQVRFQPFKDVKSDYMKAILRHHDMLRATGEAFGSRDALDKFVAEWKKFWLRM